ncbi:MAG TPA: peptide-methionine (R)-S-oxide reductase MsrB [Pyrinomonadaceae bacterium]|nr:peptide-methionine (R)-S-oxide reductase MsrB [Pyrinomonadaceae bacterium]
MNRRFLLKSVVALAVAALVSGAPAASDAQGGAANRKKKREAWEKIVKTDEEWERVLTPDQFRVMRRKGTEPPFSSPLNGEKGEGVFECAACGLPLFESRTKFNSGTGWPSFYAPVGKENVREETDVSHGMRRTEVLCARCDAHLGHVFDDGPAPTGLRYCMNGVALKFVKKSD